MELQTVHEDTQVDLTKYGEIAVMDFSGDTKIIWSRDNADEVEAARKQFNDLKKKRFTAFKVVGKTGAQGEQVDEFDPREERYIFVPAMVGG